MLELGTHYVMDCLNRLDVCKASRINDWKRLAKHGANGVLVHAKQNCTIVVDTPNRIISVEAIRNICRFEELFCDYRYKV